MGIICTGVKWRLSYFAATTVVTSVPTYGPVTPLNPIVHCVVLQPTSTQPVGTQP